MLDSFNLSARFLWREWLAGQWYIVFFAVLVAVSSITALNFYSDRLMRGIENNNATFLGGDLVIQSPTPLPVAWRDYARQLKLRTAEVLSYPSVVTANDKMQLISLRAVSDQYPLYGNSQRPEKNRIHVDSRLLSLLSLKLNDVLTLGAARFTVTKTLKNEDALFDSVWSIAPHAVILLSDVPATQTVLPGSQINYRLLIAGNNQAIHIFKKWIKPQLISTQRLLDVHDQGTHLTHMINQIENFLQLALLICVAMCCIAIVSGIRRYLCKHYADVALLRSLGAKQKQIVFHYFYKLIIVAVTAGVLGIIIGFFAQIVLEKLFQHYVSITLPPPGFNPLIFGFLLSAGLLFIFAWPVISLLPKTSPLFLWRNEVVITAGRNSFYYIVSFSALMLFIYAFTGFSILTLLFLNFIACCVALLYAFSLLLLNLLKNNLHKTSGALRRGLSQLVQYSDNSSLQYVSFTLMFTLIMVLGMMRENLIHHWKASFSKNTPNYFAINIAPADRISFQKILDDNRVSLEGIYPVTRGRLTALNGTPIMQAIPLSARDNNALHRELNLTWMQKFPSDNKQVSGEAWPVEHTGEPVISVEKKLADDLHLKMGDRLTFQIGEKSISAKIINLRKVSWASFHPNFFVIFIPGVLDHFPVTYITSFHLPKNKTDFLNQLVQRFPNMTIIDVSLLLDQVQDMVGKITYASQYLLMFALGAAILVVIASLQTSIDERKNTWQLWRILGASKKYIRQSIFVEVGCLVFFILFFAWLLARVFIYLMEIKIFDV